MPKSTGRTDKTRQLHHLEEIDCLVQTMSHLRDVVEEMGAKGFTKTRFAHLQKVLGTACNELDAMRTKECGQVACDGSQAIEC